MKLTFRTITGKTFNIDAEPSTSVGSLKASVEESQGSAFPKDAMKLVYKGKILDDEAKLVSDYGVDESGFLVVFIQKAKEAKPTPAAPAAGETSTATPAAQPAQTPAVGTTKYCIWLLAQHVHGSMY